MDTMLTKLSIKNFKRLQNVEIELGQSVVFIGPNNSGKTTALQALMLWYVGLQAWAHIYKNGFSRQDSESNQKTVNRLDIAGIPIPYTSLLWHNAIILNDVPKIIEITVEGINPEGEWLQAFRFQYANQESIYCELGDRKDVIFALSLPIAFLPSMSGLAAVEPRVERGRINVLIGEGRTAEVLRNLCYQLYDDKTHWQTLVDHMRRLFTIELLPPEYLVARGEIRMAYRDENDITLDLSSAGRGMLQMLLLLAYLYANPGTVLLLDEPDAHLEILRQREVYQLLTTLTRELDSQLIIASHSEVVLEEAAEQDMVIAFVGQPHPITKRTKSQVAKALGSIKATDYYQAIETGWVLYLEGSTDLAILQKLAKKLNHDVARHLERPFVYYLETDKPKKAEDHFYGLREAKPDLVAVGLFDRSAKKAKSTEALQFLFWRNREIENYLVTPLTLLAFAAADGDSNERNIEVMQNIINLLIPPIALQNTGDRWWRDTKMSDEFLERVFEMYYEQLGLPNQMYKTNYHILADYIPLGLIAPEVLEKLAAILAVAQRAQPRRG